MPAAITIGVGCSPTGAGLTRSALLVAQDVTSSPAPPRTAARARRLRLILRPILSWRCRGCESRLHGRDHGDSDLVSRCRTVENHRGPGGACQPAVVVCHTSR